MFCCCSRTSPSLRVPELVARVGMADIFMTGYQRAAADGYYVATLQAAFNLVEEKRAERCAGEEARRSGNGCPQKGRGC